jgi:hypothetical protein
MMLYTSSTFIDRTNFLKKCRIDLKSAAVHLRRVIACYIVEGLVCIYSRPISSTAVSHLLNLVVNLVLLI